MSHDLFRLTRKMKRLLKKDPRKYCAYMDKVKKKGKLEPITLEQAKREGLIQYGDNK